MNTNKAPEKIYLTPLMLFATPRISNSDNDIEYTRTDAFIEKALRWMISQGDVNDALSKEMIDDFKNYMKGD